MLKIAILDDYAGAALASADWKQLDGKAEITVFDAHLTEAEAAAALAPFDVLCTVRERMALPRTLIERLPNLKLITIIGARLTNLDLDAATERGVIVAHSGMRGPGLAHLGAATPELTWGLLIATVRDLARQDRRMRAGLWQDRRGHGAGRQDAGAAGPGPYRQADGQVRQGVRHGADRLEPEPHRRSGRGGGRAAGGVG